ncbi:ester cyclase [Mycolicibacterium litorale]|uniref:Ester cyclase n=2 Tax=Candidatus Mycolicibacterium alkanivorans TaxID=2954114 RepID=A0ABS9YSJ0_9MYCO|nr:ester cyclase [Candidatus Mycolicibacterium alkanivorans]
MVRETCRAQPLRAMAAPRDIDSLLTHVAVDFHNHASVATAQGRDGFGTLLRGTAEAFSPQRFTVHHILGEGDIAAINLTWYATHSGEFQGDPPTGKEEFSSAQAHFLPSAAPC